MPSTLKWIINLAIFLFIIFLLGYIGLSIGAIYDQDPQRKQLLVTAATQIGVIGAGAWNFIRPFLQLILVLVIIDWILGKWGISLQSKVSSLEWNVQTLIALIVIGAFAVAALGGINDGVGTLKDLALVVVGFYFGSQRKSVEVQTEKGKMTIVEEHDNEVRIQTEKENGEKSKEPEEGQQGRA